MSPVSSFMPFLATSVGARAAVRRVLIYRLGSLGDTVTALPCFHKIAERWPDAERIVLTNVPVNAKAAPLESVLGLGGLIHGTIAYPVGTRSPRDLQRLAGRLRALQADVLVYLTAPRGLLNAFRDRVFFSMSGIRHVIGLPATPDLQRCRRDPAMADATAPLEWEASRLARCVRALGPVDLDDPGVWDLRLTAEELEFGDAVLAPLGGAPYFAINMGGKALQKDWGLARWQSLLTQLSRQYPHWGLMIVGAADDMARAHAVAPRWSGPVVNLCGTTNPRQSAAAMRRAVGFIGHDSGPLHLAAAVGVRCVGLFGNFNEPNRWHPYGAQHRIIHRMSGLDQIGEREVEGAVRDILAPPAAPAQRPAPLPRARRARSELSPIET